MENKRKKERLAPEQSDVKKREEKQEMIARLRQFRGSIPADFQFDREEANSR